MNDVSVALGCFASANSPRTSVAIFSIAPLRIDPFLAPSLSLSAITTTILFVYGLRFGEAAVAVAAPAAKLVSSPMSRTARNIDDKPATTTWVYRKALSSVHTRSECPSKSHFCLRYVVLSRWTRNNNKLPRSRPPPLSQPSIRQCRRRKKCSSKVYSYL